METTVFSNGVTRRKWREYDSSIELWEMPKASVRTLALHYQNRTCKNAADYPGDIVVNAGPFDTSLCKPNLGFKIPGNEAHAYVRWNPYFTWDTNSTPIIKHNERQWKGTTSAAQLFRYIIENSAKWHTPSDAWDNLEPRRLFATRANGDLVLIAVAGRQANERGITLHEAAALGLSEGCNMMADGDSGGSVQTLARFSDGSTSLFTGAASADPVATFLSVTFYEPLVKDGGTTPPPAGEWPPYFTLEDPDGNRQRYDKTA